MRVKKNEKEKSLENLKLAVVGHIEWMTFLKVNHLPTAGIINHAKEYKEEPAGGGAVIALQMSKITNHKVHFFTSLGNDSLGKKCYGRLKELNLELHVAWREEPTRKGISFVDNNAERSITVIGERLQPLSNDNLPWEILKDFDGVFVTATDEKGLIYSRKAKSLLATPRVSLETILRSNIKLDALIGSALDPDEEIQISQFKDRSKTIILTKGEKGGEFYPGGKYKAIKIDSPLIDSYGCGDNFAAGVTAGIAASWSIEESIELGAKYGAICATRFGPFL